MLRTEYPRPNFIRQHWTCLNGVWEFDVADYSKKPISYFLQNKLAYEINVPFSPNTDISGVNFSQPLYSVWYKRSIHIRKEQLQGSVLLNFGAVDYRAEIYINSQLVAIHKGGYTAFSVDISRYLIAGKNYIAVNALDDHSDNAIPSGWQTKNKHACLPPIIGIWQSVWLEFSGKSYLSHIRITPSTAEKNIYLQGTIVGYADSINVAIHFDKKLIADYSYKLGADSFSIYAPLNSQPQLWDIYDSKLYDITITLMDKNKNTLDMVISYCGFRDISIHDKKLHINGKPFIFRGVSDIGWYGAGGITPTHADIIKQDLMSAISLGYNGAILSQRIAEPLYHYFADMLGFLLIVECPVGAADTSTPIAKSNIQREWLDIIKSNYGHPSIAFWSPLPYHYGKSDVATTMYDLTKTWDNTRPILSGGGLIYKADIRDYRMQNDMFDTLIENLYSVKNGDYKSDRAEKKAYRKNPALLNKKALNILPLMITKTASFEIPYQDAIREQDFLQLYDKYISTIIASGAVGFCFNSLYDYPNFCGGILNADRDIKLTRDGQNKLFQINNTRFN